MIISFRQRKDPDFWTVIKISRHGIKTDELFDFCVDCDNSSPETSNCNCETEECLGPTRHKLEINERIIW